MTPWLVGMDWTDALFLHWPVPAASLEARLPGDLQLDTFEGTAWVSIVAFRIAHARPRGVPHALGWPTFPEINLRTYVRDAERAGIWFFSLDATSRVAVELARRFVHLPYYSAAVESAFESGALSYRLERTDRRAPAARLDARASFGGGTRTAAPGTLEHWLVERYCFFTAGRRGRTLRGDVVHQPWPLRDATAEVSGNTLLAAARIVPSSLAPIAHASSGVVTRFLPLRRRAG